MSIWKIGAVGACIGFAGIASAQVPVPNPFNLTYRIGAFLPLTDSGRDIGQNWLAFGVDWPLVSAGVPMTGVGGSAFVSLDYYEKDGNRSIPIMLSYSAGYSGLRYVSGFGFGFNKLEGGDSKIVVQYMVGFSYDLSGPLSLHGRYWQASDSELRGIAFYLGARF